MEQIKNFIYGLGVIGAIGLITGVIVLFIMLILALLPLLMPFIIFGLITLAGGLLLAMILITIYFIGKNALKG